MIKVIRHGTKRKATCPECGCVFLGEKEDCMPLKHGGFLMHCPDCGTACRVDGFMSSLKTGVQDD